MPPTNCWEFTNCGREPGGHSVSSLGECPASKFELANGFLGGNNGGRGCTYIAGTFCGGQIQGTYYEKEKNCQQCDFYKSLRSEFGSEFSINSFNGYVTERYLNDWPISAELEFDHDGTEN